MIHLNHPSTTVNGAIFILPSTLVFSTIQNSNFEFEAIVALFNLTLGPITQLLPIDVLP